MNARSGERGILMVGLMAAVAIMVILSTVGFQAWDDIIRRDNEAEMMFRAREIARSIVKYKADKGIEPTELKQLIESGSKGQYFLRRLYKDPLVKDGKWGLLFVAPGGTGIYDPTAEDGAGVDASGNPIIGRASPFGSPSPSPGTGLGQGQLADQSGVRGGLRGSAFGAGNALSGEGGEQGLPIAGVKSLCKKKPFRVFREQTEYSKWLFTEFDQDLLGPVPGMTQANPGQAGATGAMPGQVSNPNAGGFSGGGLAPVNPTSPANKDK